MRKASPTNRVKEFRVRRLWTQKDLATAAGVHEWTVRRAEKGGKLSPLTEERIAQAYGLTREEVFPEPEEAAV